MRASPRAVRFAEIKVGDQLVRRWGGYSERIIDWYYIVTDLWFDPVAGQRDETAGRKVAIRRIDPRTGDPRERKEPHTIRGLASQGFKYSAIDYIAQTKALIQSVAEGNTVVGIGKGHVIRRRPKLPGRQL